MYNYVCLLAVRTFIIIISCKLFPQTLHWLWLSIAIFISFSDLRRELHPLSFILSFPWDERKESFIHTHTLVTCQMVIKQMLLYHHHFVSVTFVENRESGLCVCVQSREKEVSISFLSLCAVQHIAFSLEMKIKKRPGLHMCLSLAKKRTATSMMMNI